MSHDDAESRKVARHMIDVDKVEQMSAEAIDAALHNKP